MNLGQNDSNSPDDRPILLIEELSKMLGSDNLSEIRQGIEAIREHLEEWDIFGYPCLNEDLGQILRARSLERVHYYIKRLLKSLSAEKSSLVNDINLHRWKSYHEIITDSLWIIPKRDRSGVHQASYWGNFVPQIPNQLLHRYTKKGDWVLDAFSGSGTTLIECRRLGRNGIGIELQEGVAVQSLSLIEKEDNPHLVQTSVLVGDSAEVDICAALAERGVEKADFLLLHPPYWDIIRFSDQERDLSNAPTLDDFLTALGRVMDNTFPCLKKGRYCALVIGDKYQIGKWIALGFLTMQEATKRGMKLKSIVVKNFEDTKGKQKQKGLWRYRALAGGFYVFKHEYIFIFQK